MTIVLMRHGQTSAAGADPPLSGRGRQQVSDVATALDRSGFTATRIVHSGLQRAFETASLLGSVYSAPPPLEEDPRLQPDEDAAVWPLMLDGENSDIAFVSHQPFLTRLCGLLLAGHEALRPVEFRTATAAVLRRKDMTWTLETVIHPQQ